MERIAEDLYRLGGFPRYAINQYVMGDVLVDAGTRWAGRRLVRQLRGRRLAAHVLTHAHPDHQGASHFVCEALGLPLWCGAGDADAAEDPRLILDRMPRHWTTRAFSRFWTGPGHPVARRLRGGDEVGGFVAIETPGHTAGHLSFWREGDRVLVLGDVLAGFHPLTRRPGLREPPWFFSADPAENRRSARQVAALEPRLVCFGHGPPLADPRAFARFAESLPD